MILTNGKTNVLKLLAGNAAGKKITHILVGTNPTAVTGADTTITGAVAVAVESVTYPAADIEVYTATLPDSVPYMVIAEMGLRNEDGVLVHRKVLSPTFSKAVGLAYTLKYQIKVV